MDISKIEERIPNHIINRFQDYFKSRNNFRNPSTYESEGYQIPILTKQDFLDIKEYLKKRERKQKLNKLNKL